MNLRDFGQPSILAGERSGLLTLDRGDNKRSMYGADEKLPRFGIANPRSIRITPRDLRRAAASRRNPAYPTAAITFSSIAIGVGNAVTSIVVRVGFGLAGPAKYSA